jgi:general secretion pathway protein A
MPHQRLLQVARHGDYYGLTEAPFSLTPDPKFAYPSESHDRALRTILHALSRREGLLVVTGDIGCGKTTLCRRLLPLLPERTFLSLVLNPFLTADDLLKQVLEDYGLVSADDSRRGALARASCHELARTLQEFLNSLSQIDGTAVIIVDEAQNLPLRTLEQIRLLSNFETDTRKLLQIILVGQRNLEPILELDELRQLTQRISRRCRIEPLKPGEVPGYVEHRLAVAMPANEPPRVRFTPRAFNTISRLSHGVPRIINLVCDRALEIAHAKGTASIDRRGVLDAAKDLELHVPRVVRIVPDVSFRAALGAGAAAAALVAVIGISAVASRTGWPAWSTTLLSVAGDNSTEPLSSPAKPTIQLEPALDVESSTASPSPAASQPREAAAPPTAILESAPAYELTVASFETAGRAAAVAADLVGRGHPARVAVSTSGRWQMVMVGPYTSLSEATEAKNTLQQSGFSAIRIARSQQD